MKLWTLQNARLFVGEKVSLILKKPYSSCLFKIFEKRKGFLVIITFDKDWKPLFMEIPRASKIAPVIVEVLAKKSNSSITILIVN